MSGFRGARNSLRSKSNTSFGVLLARSQARKLFVMPDDDIRRLRDDVHREITFLKEQLNALATDLKVLIACNPPLLEQVKEHAAGAGERFPGVHLCQLFVNKYGSQ